MQEQENLVSISPFNSLELPKAGLLDMNKPMFDLEPFREAARFFEKHKHYPHYTTSDDIGWIDRSPNSEFTKYWKEEDRRCIEGVTIGRHYMTAQMYHHLNYNRMWKIPELTSKQKKDLVEGKSFEVDRVPGFPDPWDGTFHVMNYIAEAKRRGQHAGVFKSRGQGISYVLESESNRLYHHRSGAKVYVIAPTKKMLEDTDYILYRIWEGMDFITKYTPFFKVRQGGRSDTIMVRKSRSIQTEKGKKISSDSEDIRSVQGLIATAGKQFRGPRGDLIIFDEGGVNKSVDTLISVSRPSVEQNGVGFGQIIVAGTGGSKLADLAGFSKVMTQPSVFNMLGVKDVFSKLDNGKEICLFLGAYWNLAGFYDNKGRSDVNGAYQHELKRRAAMAKITGKQDASYIQELAERAMFPREALMNTHSTNMPVDLIYNRIDTIQGKPRVGEVGLMDTANPKLGIFLPSNTVEPYEMFPTRGGHKRGAVTILHRPIEGHKYVSGVDAYAQDNSTTTSHGAMYIWDTTADRLVAWFVGRPKTTVEFYKITIAMNYMYSVRKGCLIENNIFEFNSVYRSEKAFEVLAFMPTVAKAIVPNMKKTTTSRIGMPMNTKIYNVALNIIAEWLVQPNEDNPDMLNIDTIEDIGLLRELAMSEEDQNFDRLAASVQMVMQREEVRMLLKLNRNKKESSAGKQYAVHLKNIINDTTPK